MIPSYLVPTFAPQPNPDALVQVPNFRVAVLTDRLLRIEYSPVDRFEDRPSQAIWCRAQPAPHFEQRTIREGKGSQRTETLEISTAKLSLKILVGQPPSPKAVSITLKSSGHTWKYGDADVGNLKGTCRTLDQVSGQTRLEPGLLSKDGWAVLDDSDSLVFNEQGWLESRGASPGSLDLYFFGYGRNYQDCLRDYRRISGDVPLLPRWALGNWWSRYWAYTQEEILNLIEEFQNHQVPFSVFIIDMDWHITQTGNASSGWTGYTWNKELFPDSKALIHQIHQMGLKTALNLHPAEGIYPHESQYQEFARRMGIDPASKKPIPFDLADPKFAKAYFELLHHPQEADGIDFWWLDWQQGNFSTLPGLDPLWWLNHLHFFDLGRPRKGLPARRPFIFSRWGGMGNHRYPIGFSGDTVVSWESLAFQPYFTAAAANVGYGWWSHDIGGHMSGTEDPELYTRWVQYGVFSPIFRLHCTNNPFHERRPYAYNAEIAKLATHAMQLRHAFIPYLYTMAWRDHQDALALCRPLYHLDPASEAAYHSPETYAFGSELIVAPHTAPAHPDTRLSRQVVWLPEGDWFNFFNGEYFPGGHHAVYGKLEDVPVYARAGAIIPLAPLPTWGGVENPSHLRIHIFPGADNQFELYEDDGNSTAYQEGKYGITPFTQSWSPEKSTISIGPARGDVTQCPYLRTYELKFWGISEPDNVLVEINNNLCPCFPEYNPDHKILTLPIEAELSPYDNVTVTISKGKSPFMLREDHTLERCQRLLENFRLESYTKLGIMERLPEILQNPAILARSRPTVTDAQLRAILETITRAGVHRIDHNGDDPIILWNRNPIQDQFPVTYQLSVNQIFRGYYDTPYHYEEGALPEFLTLHPPSQFGGHSWELKVQYGSVLTVRMANTGQKT